MWKNRIFLPADIDFPQAGPWWISGCSFQLDKTHPWDLRICSGFMGFGGCVEGIKAAMEAKEKECKKKKELAT